MDKKTRNNVRKGFVKCALFFLCLGFCLVTDNFEVRGARVTGENGVIPVVPESEKKSRRPAKVKPPQSTPSYKMPARRNQALKRKTSDKYQGLVEKASNQDERYVTINFDNVAINIFIRFISELTGKNFVIDKAVKGKVTIISPTKITVAEAYKVFESVLEVNGYTTVPAGSIVKIVPSISARSKDIETRLKREISIRQDTLVTQLIPLKYADPDRLKKLFAPLISKTSVVVSYPPTGMLIVTDVLSNINRLLRIIEVIDVEGIGEEISVIPIEHATASVTAKSLNSIFQRRGGKTKKGVAEAPVIRIVPDERTNALIILASEDDTLRVRQLIDLLDKETPRGEGDIRVFYLQNANAEDLAQVLMSIPSKGTRGAKKGKAPVVSKEVQIVADKATNALVITSNKEDYLVLEDVIKKLDIPRRMVYIEALIMEVDIGTSFDLGIRWNAFEDIGSHDGRTIGAFGGSIPGDVLDAAVKGFALGVIGEAITIGGTVFPSLSAVIRAYQSDSNVHILSTPQIMTTNNEEAEIVVGENRPFLTRQDRSGGDVDYSNYEFKDVGITLNITPQINRERFVRLKIYQELTKVSQKDEYETEGLLTTLKRTAKTTVIIKDGHTIVIGGLIEKMIDDTTYKVPFLGDIPILGWLFRSNSKTGNKTNLFIFITPHIIENPTEAAEVYKEKKEQIDTIKEGGIKMYKGPSKAAPEQILEPDEL